MIKPLGGRWRLAEPGSQRRWSLALKIGLLNIGLCAALAIALTWLGTFRAFNGLQEQAEAALAADARVVADGVDDWHAQRTTQLKSLANMHLVRNYVAVPDERACDLRNARPRRPHQPQQRRLRRRLDRAGGPHRHVHRQQQPGDIGQNVAQRDYFQESMKGHPYITGVSISTITNAPRSSTRSRCDASRASILGVLRSRSKLDWVHEQVASPRTSRVGAGATGVLLDESGLVISSSVRPSWLLRPIVPLSPEVSARARQRQALGQQPGPGPDRPARPRRRPSASRSATALPGTMDGIELRAVAVPLRGTSWSYVAALPVSTFQAAANELPAQRRALGRHRADCWQPSRPSCTPAGSATPSR